MTRRRHLSEKAQRGPLRAGATGTTPPQTPPCLTSHRLVTCWPCLLLYRRDGWGLDGELSSESPYLGPAYAGDVATDAAARPRYYEQLARVSPPLEFVVGADRSVRWLLVSPTRGPRPQHERPRPQALNLKAALLRKVGPGGGIPWKARLQTPPGTSSTSGRGTKSTGPTGDEPDGRGRGPSLRLRKLMRDEVNS